MKNILSIIVVLSLVAVVLGSCTPKAPIGATIKVADIPDLTGPISPQVADTHKGLMDYYDNINAKGGVNGIKIENLWVDSKNDLPTIQSAYSKFKGEGVIEIYCGLDGMDSLKQSLANDRIVGLTAAGLVASLWPPAWTYGTKPRNSDGAAGVIDLVLESWKENRALNVGYILADASFGRGILGGGPQYAQKKGCRVVLSEIVPLSTTDTSIILAKAKDAQVDILIVGVGAGLDILILKDAMRTGFSKPIYAAPPGDDLVTISKAVPTVKAGSFLSWQERLITMEDVKGVKDVFGYYGTKYGTSDTPTSAWINGWSCGAITVEAIRLALEKVPYEKLDGAALREYGFNRMKDFSVDGLRSPITYYPGIDQRGSDSCWLYTIDSGKPVRLSDIKKPRRLPTVTDQGELINGQWVPWPK